MADTTSENGDLSESDLVSAADRVLENLAELEPELVSAAIYRDQRLVSATSDSPGWSEAGTELLAALEAGSGESDLDSAHIACADGEVFAVSESGLDLVAVTGRFVLASLTTYDMRMALRDVRSPNVSPGAESERSEDA